MIASFKHECGCEFVRRANGYEQAYTCDTHGGSLSFGGAQAAAQPYRGPCCKNADHNGVPDTLTCNPACARHTACDRSPNDRTFTFSEAEARRLSMLINADHYDILMERRKLVQIQQANRDDSWSGRLAEIDREEALLRGMVRKIQRAAQ